MENQGSLLFQGRIGVLMVTAFLSMLLLSIASEDQKDSNKSNIIHCLPCSQKFLVRSNFENHYDSEVSLAEDFLFSTSCELAQHNISGMLGFSITKRHLNGEGSHRHIVTSIGIDIQSEMSKFDMDFYDCVIIERLPAGIFADPFELQHLVQRGVFSDASVFGDTNLELPSAISNCSVVEIHKNIHDGMGLMHLSGLNITFEIPLHARYPNFVFDILSEVFHFLFNQKRSQDCGICFLKVRTQLRDLFSLGEPLDSKGYSEVVMAPPVVLLRYMPRSNQHDSCSSLIIQMNTRSNNEVSWKIPCGNKELTGTVSLVTFASALLSALLIVLVSITYLSSTEKVKEN